MSYQVIASFKVKTLQGEKELHAGQMIIIPHDKATLLIRQGKIALSPELREALEESSAIMEHDGGLSIDQDDKYAWCREVCMLTLGQRQLCELVKPCPKEETK